MVRRLVGTTFASHFCEDTNASPPNHSEILCVHVCESFETRVFVCVCVRERERLDKRERERSDKRERERLVKRERQRVSEGK